MSILQLIIQAKAYIIFQVEYLIQHLNKSLLRESRIKLIDCNNNDVSSNTKNQIRDSSRGVSYELVESYANDLFSNVALDESRYVTMFHSTSPSPNIELGHSSFPYYIDDTDIATPEIVNKALIFLSFLLFSMFLGILLYLFLYLFKKNLTIVKTKLSEEGKRKRKYRSRAKLDYSPLKSLDVNTLDRSDLIKPHRRRREKPGSALSILGAENVYPGEVGFLDEIYETNCDSSLLDISNPKETKLSTPSNIVSVSTLERVDSVPIQIFEQKESLSSPSPSTYEPIGFTSNAAEGPQHDTPILKPTKSFTNNDEPKIVSENSTLVEKLCENKIIEKLSGSSKSSISEDHVNAKLSIKEETAGQKGKLIHTERSPNSYKGNPEKYSSKHLDTSPKIDSEFGKSDKFPTNEKIMNFCNLKSAQKYELDNSINKILVNKDNDPYTYFETSQSFANEENTKMLESLEILAFQYGENPQDVDKLVRFELSNLCFSPFKIEKDDTIWKLRYILSTNYDGNDENITGVIEVYKRFIKEYLDNLIGLLKFKSGISVIELLRDYLSFADNNMIDLKTYNRCLGAMIDALTIHPLHVDSLSTSVFVIICALDVSSAPKTFKYIFKEVLGKESSHLGCICVAVASLKYYFCFNKAEIISELTTFPNQNKINTCAYQLVKCIFTNSKAIVERWKLKKEESSGRMVNTEKNRRGTLPSEFVQLYLVVVKIFLESEEIPSFIQYDLLTTFISRIYSQVVQVLCEGSITLEPPILKELQPSLGSQHLSDDS
ncbi:Piso0_005459 [Millerozyma farinosa CBS 7064]|uniref:Piso0_005459 protein n=1 Tax=Pichia sorbitophila (strain ATCC MYA-4447 / BCRC 22081 / CBS 7064 / NBRC 10061 / NRRL Y-12695) TaxID=559304 RepID=G8Y556_PICSO|nr:Piso0_005459 [Millerozyma farinosa CBS 7064]